MKCTRITLLILFSLLVWEKSTEVQANLNSPLRKSTPKPAITCWTCPAKASNRACNVWAPDIPCPENKTVCETIHTIDAGTGSSLSVVKKCSSLRDCNRTTIGCRLMSNHSKTRCVSCCMKSYCNEDVAYDNPMAFRLSSEVYNTGSIVNCHIHLSVLITVAALFNLPTG